MTEISTADRTFTVFRVAFMLLLLYTPQPSDSVTCYKTNGRRPNATTCEIQQEKDHFCFLDCEMRDHSGIYVCFQDCLYSSIAHCRSNITTISYISFCCTTSYCNILNDSSLANIIASINSPTESTKAPNDDDDDDDDDDEVVDVVIALSIGVALVVLTLTLVTVLIMCHWRRWKKNQLRQRAALVIN